MIEEDCWQSRRRSLGASFVLSQSKQAKWEIDILLKQEKDGEKEEEGEK